MSSFSPRCFDIFAPISLFLFFFFANGTPFHLSLSLDETFYSKSRGALILSSHIRRCIVTTKQETWSFPHLLTAHCDAPVISLRFPVESPFSPMMIKRAINPRRSSYSAVTGIYGRYGIRARFSRCVSCRAIRTPPDPSHRGNAVNSLRFHLTIRIRRETLLEGIIPVREFASDECAARELQYPHLLRRRHGDKPMFPVPRVLKESSRAAQVMTK